MNDNNGTVSISSFGFGASLATFVINLTVNFTNATSDVISVGNATSFTSGNNLSLTSNLIALSQKISTTGSQSYTGNVRVNGTISLSSGGSNITVTGKIDQLHPTFGSANITSYTSNASWSVPAGVRQADVLVVGKLFPIRI